VSPLRFVYHKDYNFNRGLPFLRQVHGFVLNKPGQIRAALVDQGVAKASQFESPDRLHAACPRMYLLPPCIKAIPFQSRNSKGTWTYPYQGDAIGDFDVSADALAERDRRVARFTLEQRAGLVVLPAGGYSAESPSISAAGFAAMASEFRGGL
jgi:hypothetical protein